MLFLGLETLSIALYVLAASHLRRIAVAGVGLKYFVLGGVLVGVLPLRHRPHLRRHRHAPTCASIVDLPRHQHVLLDERACCSAGMALLLVGLGFKVAAVPFHSWTPDVYEGAPTPVTGFMASAVKAAAFAALLRVFVVAFDLPRATGSRSIYALAVLTLVVGPVLAIVQTNVKRMLAYSSISHAGFILVASRRADGSARRRDRGTAAALFYLLAYAVMVLGTLRRGHAGRRGAGDGDQSLDDYRGLARAPARCWPSRSPCFLLAQAGVPLTVRLHRQVRRDRRRRRRQELRAGRRRHAHRRHRRLPLPADHRQHVPRRPEPGDEAPQPVRIPFSAGLGLALTLGFTVVVGFVPGFVVDFARDAVPHLVAARALAPARARDRGRADPGAERADPARRRLGSPTTHPASFARRTAGVPTRRNGSRPRPGSGCSGRLAAAVERHAEELGRRDPHVSKPGVAAAPTSPASPAPPAQRRRFSGFSRHYPGHRVRSPPRPLGVVGSSPRGTSRRRSPLEARPALAWATSSS